MLYILVGLADSTKTGDITIIDEFEDHKHQEKTEVNSSTTCCLKTTVTP